MAVAGCGGGSSSGGPTPCGFDGCANEVSAQALGAVSGHTVSFTVCRSAQCASGTLFAQLAAGASATLVVPGASCNVGSSNGTFGISCAPSGTVPFQSGEEWSMWAADDGPAVDGGVSASTVLLDVKKAIVLPAASGGACGTVCSQVSLN